MRENDKKTQGIFFGVIGVATLLVAIIGATFAYFTANRSTTENMTGNAATISFGLTITKKTTVDETAGGSIPMTDTMVEAAVASENGACLDDNKNAVCQIYEVTVTNQGTAGMYLDGFVNLTGGLRAVDNTSQPGKTTMKWVQAFYNSTTGKYSVTGDHLLAPGVTKTISSFSTGHSTTLTTISSTQPTSTYTYGGNNYTYINQNYLRVSKIDNGTATYTRANDAASTLVINQYLTPNDNVAGSGTDQTKLYFVVWLTETGTNQTATTATQSQTDTSLNFFSGKVVFNSAQGGEVTGTFGGYTKVTPDT